MYKIYADNIPIYDDTSADPYVKVASPTLSLEESAAGSLKMTIPPGNAGYDYIVPMVTDIRVEKDGGIIWDGRVIQESKDFWNNRALTCEGALAFLNDTTQPQAEHSYTGGQAIRLYLQDLIAVHNAHAAANRRIEFDNRCTVDVVATDLTATTNYESTMECVNKLVEGHGGFLRIRYANGSRLLDYLTDNSSARNTNKQTIEFGKNLMDFTSSLDSTEYATVIVPLGAKLEDKKVEGLENYLTVEGSSLGDGSRYVKASQDVIDQRGWIEKVVHFDDETDEDNLYKLGEKYLNELQYNTLTIELSAFDLHYLNSEIETVHLGDIIRVISEPHGIDRDFKVRKLEIPMDRPQDTTFQLGDNVQTSLTSTNNKINSEILAKLNEAPDVDADAILQAAQDNASALMNMTLNGFVTLLTETDPTTGIYSEGLYISASKPLKDEQGNFVAQRFWKWSSSGLGYTDDGGQTWKTAITMDGSIVGERIAAGSIHGSKITAGTLALTTAAGEEACTISLKVLDLPSDALEIGDLDQNDGSNIGSAAQDTARTVIKYYLTAGTTVTVNGYSFEPFLYTDNIDNESGFSMAYGSVSSGSFLIRTTGWYRFVLTGASGAGVAINPNDLPKMAASVSLGNPSTVLSSADIRINGMVTFSALNDDRTEEEGNTTVINGGNIKTGFVKGTRIDAKGMTVTRTEQDGSKTVTFMVDNDGNVTINGNVILDQNSLIYFGPSTTKTIGDISEEASSAEDTANKLAYGIYDPPSGGIEIDGQTYTSAFISQRTIYAPTIIANDLIAQAPSGSNHPSGNIGLKDANGANQLVITYRTTQTTDGAPGVYFDTAATGVYNFDLPVNATGLTISSSTPGVTPQSYFAGRVTLSSQGSVLDLGGTLVLQHGITYVSSYNDLPKNAEVGQICFVLN